MPGAQLRIGLPRLLDRIARANRRELILLGTTEKTLKFKDWHPMHFTAALQRLAKVAEHSDLPFVRSLVTTALHRDRLPHYGPDQYGMLLWSVGKLGKNSVEKNTLLELLRRVEENSSDMSPQALSSALYTLAKHQARFEANQSHRIMDKALTCLEDLDAYSPQSIANILWSYGKLGHSMPPSILGGIDRHLCANFDRYEGQHVSNILWALATMECPEGSRALFASICDKWLAAPSRRCCLTPQSLANVLWAFGKTPVDWMLADIKETVMSLGTYLITRFPGVEPRAIANCLWGVGVWAARDHTVGLLYVKLLDAVAPSLRSRLSSMNPTTMVALCWCYAKDNKEMVAYLARAAMTNLDKLSIKDFPTLFWAALSVLCRDEAGVLCGALERSMPYSPAQVSKCLWALVDAGYFDDSLSSQLVSTMTLDSSVAPKHYVAIVWACSQMYSPWPSSGHFDCLIEVLPSILPKCGTEELAQLAASFAIAGRTDLASQCLDRVHEANSEAALSQIAQAKISCAVESGVLIPAGIIWPSPTHSHFQLQVFEALKGLPFDMVVRQEAETAVGPVDAIVTNGLGQKVVVEADGPSHFLRSTRGQDCRRLNTRSAWKGNMASKLLNAGLARVSIAEFSQRYLTGGKERAHGYVRELVVDAFD